MENIRALNFSYTNKSDKLISKDGKPVKFNSIRNIETLESEFLKVQILCINCHRMKLDADEKNSGNDQKPKSKRALKSRKALMKRKKIVNIEKLKREKCNICDMKVTETTFPMFDFDHIDPLSKLDYISHMVVTRKPIRLLKAEILKCNLLCARCHRIKSYDSGEYGYSGIREATLLKRKQIDQEKRAGVYVHPPLKKIRIDL